MKKKYRTYCLLSFLILITIFLESCAQTIPVDKLENMVNNMGTLSLEYSDRDIAVYEISNAAGTKFYPVVFTQEDDGRWKIAVF